MTAPEGELPPRVNLFPTRDGMCVSRDSTYKGNIPYVLASELEAEKQRGLRAVEEAFEEAAKEAESWMGVFNLESFDDKDVRRVANPNQIAARIRHLAARAGEGKQ